MVGAGPAGISTAVEARGFKVDLSYRKSHLSRMNQIDLAEIHGMRQAGRLDLLVIGRDSLDCPLPSPQAHA
jgi:hypothetical protein